LYTSNQDQSLENGLDVTPRVLTNTKKDVIKNIIDKEDNDRKTKNSNN